MDQQYSAEFKLEAVKRIEREVNQCLRLQPRGKAYDFAGLGKEI